ncbi:MAG TPA: hypothetical protein VHE34_09655 [Puia sp.]|uniref:hypothetical protein n=1 Tax=Puia sp. TaxID=2045100 RepID=UPI002B9E32CE|nr:hypothetical protein [Puia sp.]HVU95479.1 hypothetical protein [Puia sp.]
MKPKSRLSTPAVGDLASFASFLLSKKRSGSTVILAVSICQFAVFKLLYPFPDFFSDSYSYIYAANDRLGANIWPIGYSKFLLIFHWLTHSAMALNLFQYLFFALSALYFYRTVEFNFSPGKKTKLILRIFLFFNPLNLFLANFVSSDGLFAAISLLWLTELIWIIYRPNIFHLIFLSTTCFVAFTFRYNAMYYPLIAVPAFLIGNTSITFKVLGITLAPLLIIPFIAYSSNAAKEMSGTPQFPPILGGWQWANNALYIREYINEDSTRFPSPQMSELDHIARGFYRIVPPKDRELPSFVGNFFIKVPYAPLKVYMARHFEDTSDFSQVVAWAKVAPLFKQYGLYIIKRHPLPFFRYYLLLNTKNYFLPPLEKLEIYNLGEDKMSRTAVRWFDYSDNRVWAISTTFHGYLFAAFPAFFLLLNLFFAWNITTFIRRKGFSRSPISFAYTIGLVTALVAMNAAFSVFANIVVFRYQIFPMYTLLWIVLLTTDYIEQRHVPSLQKNSK